MAYYRKSADQTLLVIGNYKTQPQTLTLPSKIKHIVLNNLPQLKTEEMKLCWKAIRQSFWKYFHKQKRHRAEPSFIRFCSVF